MKNTWYLEGLSWVEYYIQILVVTFDLENLYKLSL